MDATRIAVLFNATCWLCMFFIQNYEARVGRIPLRRPHDIKKPQNGFLYIQDYHTTLIGDLLGLTIMNVAILEKRESLFTLPTTTMAVAVLAALGITTLMNWTWLGPTHKPDWAYPRAGEVSYGGKLHLVYFFTQLTLALIGIWLLATNQLLPKQQLMLGLGGLVYLSAMLLDVKSKRWAKIPLRQTKKD